jgi:hypothetical protein
MRAESAGALDEDALGDTGIKGKRSNK